MASWLDSVTFTVVDTETTGFRSASRSGRRASVPPLRAGTVVGRFTTLVNPGRPIPTEAYAVHGIVDADVARSPRVDEIEPIVRAACADAVVVAHNARFELGFLPWLATRPTLCTMRLAMHLIDAPTIVMPRWPTSSASALAAASPRIAYSRMRPLPRNCWRTYCAATNAGAFLPSLGA